MISCWNCDENLTEQDNIEFEGEVKGEKLTVKTRGFLCSCGFKTVGSKNMDAYNIAIADAYRKKHGLLTTGDILKRKDYNLSQQKFADCLGTHVQSIKRWEHGGVQEESMDKLMRYTFAELAKTRPRKLIKDTVNFITTDTKKVADYILHIAAGVGEAITPMKLQKLLYYADGYCLAFYDKPLINERFKAWPHGPVVESVYKEYKETGNQSISKDPGRGNLHPEIQLHIREIMRVYGGYSASELRNMTHQEEPWKNARGNLREDEPSNQEISKEDMKIYFRKISDKCDIFLS
jgi:putative zinc finger/helix-turn-helix YgiT family protein